MKNKRQKPIPPPNQNFKESSEKPLPSIIDMTEICKKYEGQWVVLDDNYKVLESSFNLDKLDSSKGAIMKVPSNRNYSVLQLSCKNIFFWPHQWTEWIDMGVRRIFDTSFGPTQYPDHSLKLQEKKCLVCNKVKSRSERIG